MSLNDQMLDVIQAIYDAALDETLWPQALRQLSDFTGSQAATFWVLDGSEEPQLPIFNYINFDPAFIGEYLKQITPLDPWNRYLLAHPDEPIVHDGLVISEREKDRHPYFDWHKRFSDTRFRLIGRVTPAPSVHAGVALHRTHKAGGFQSDDIDRFRVLYAHLKRALTIGFKMAVLGATQQCTTELLDRSLCAIVFLDRRRRIVYANSSATLLHSAADGVRLGADGPILARRQDNHKLQRLIAKALSSASSSTAERGGILRASRPSNKSPYVVVVSAIEQRYPALSVFRPAVCVMITDPDRAPNLSVEHLQTVFALTPAEARLATLLAGGAELRSAGEDLGITYGTARARLAQIFQKTETRRQSELVHLLLTAFQPV